MSWVRLPWKQVLWQNWVCRSSSSSTQESAPHRKNGSRIGQQKLGFKVSTKAFQYHRELRNLSGSLELSRIGHEPGIELDLGTALD